MEFNSDDFVIERQVTNTRVGASKGKAELIVSSTEGVIRLSEKASVQLAVASGDYLGVCTAIVKGESGIYAFKGWNKDGKSVGAKLASPTKKIGGNLVCSSQGAYVTLEGTDAHNRVYSIASEPFEKNDIKFYKLDFVETREKAEKLMKKEVTETVAA